MDYLERYLQAIRFWLPRDPKGDLLAELADDLRSQIEDRQTALGRPLQEEEVLEILKRTGPPMRVAGQYLPAEPWLDPVLALVYRFVLKVVLLWIMVPVFALSLVPALIRSQHPLLALNSALLSYLNSALLSVGTITVVFLVIQRLQRRAGASQTDWNPRRLPPLRPGSEARRIPRANSVAELVINLLFLGWWLGRFGALPPGWAVVKGTLISLPSSLWADFHQACFWPVAALAALAMVRAGMTFASPHWVRPRLALKTLAELAAALILGGFLRSRGLGWPGFATMGHQDPSQLVDAVLQASLFAGAIFSAASAGVGAIRLLRGPQVS
jgi:hypothetical protein